MVIDGEVVKLRCKDCGEQFSKMLGYGPIFPTPSIRRCLLKESDTRCPKGGSRNYEEYSGGILGRLASWLLSL